MQQNIRGVAGLTPPTPTDDGDGIHLVILDTPCGAVLLSVVPSTTAAVQEVQYYQSVLPHMREKITAEYAYFGRFHEVSVRRHSSPLEVFWSTDKHPGNFHRLPMSAFLTI